MGPTWCSTDTAMFKRGDRMEQVRQIADTIMLNYRHHERDILVAPPLLAAGCMLSSKVCSGHGELCRPYTANTVLHVQDLVDDDDIGTPKAPKLLFDGGQGRPCPRAPTKGRGPRRLFDVSDMGFATSSVATPTSLQLCVLWLHSLQACV